jgi:hypothetical protein
VSERVVALMNWENGKPLLHRVPFFESPPATIEVETITVSGPASRRERLLYCLDHVGADGIPHYRKVGQPRPRAEGER